MDHSIQYSEELVEKLEELYEEIKINDHEIKNIDSPDILSMQNLKAFLILRNKKVKGMDLKLLHAGLSPYKNIHPHIHYSIQKMLYQLHHMDNVPQYILNPDVSNLIRKERVMNLFGKLEQSVMVTLQASMLDKPDIIKDLLSNGMNIARINCAHDSPEIWKHLVQKIRDAETELGLMKGICKIHMELAGPKIRVKKVFNPEKVIKEERPFIKVNPGEIISIIRQEKLTDKHSEDAMAFSINHPNALINVRLKDKVFFNDGKIIGEICSITDQLIGIEILHTHKKGAKLREEAGINLPDSFVHFVMPAMTETDISLLPFIYELSDSIGLSFVHHPRDLEKIRICLSSLPPKKIGIIAKIETREAIHHLSKIIYEGLHFDLFGIMIARGDLAVELGFTKLASIQEEIIRLCEAAHIPIIWATGVLENLTKKGIPIRSELTDAYMGLRTNCIMLNKGSYIVESLKTINELVSIKHSSEKRNGEESFIQYKVQ